MKALSLSFVHNLSLAFKNFISMYFAFKVAGAVIGFCMVYKNVEKTSVVDKLIETMKNSNQHYKTIQAMKSKEKAKIAKIADQYSKIEDGTFKGGKKMTNT